MLIVIVMTVVIMQKCLPSRIQELQWSDFQKLKYAKHSRYAGRETKCRDMEQHTSCFNSCCVEMGRGGAKEFARPSRLKILQDWHQRRLAIISKHGSSPWYKCCNLLIVSYWVETKYLFRLCCKLPLGYQLPGIQKTSWRMPDPESRAAQMRWHPKICAEK